MDFLKGVTQVQRHKQAKEILNIGHPNPFSLVSLLVDIKIPQEQRNLLESGLSFFDKHGIETFKSKMASTQQVGRNQQGKDHYNGLLKRASKGTLHKLDRTAAKEILHHQRVVGCLAFSIALFTNLIVAAWETFTKVDLDSDGFVNLFYTCNNISHLEVPEDGVKVKECPMSPPGKVVCDIDPRSLLYFVVEPVVLRPGKMLLISSHVITGTIVEWWARMIPIMGVCVVIEILLLGIVTVKGACKIASEYQYRLYPLNPSRLFVINALLRTCFEMGNPKSKVIVQVDPETQPSARRRLRIAVVSTSVFSVVLLIAPPSAPHGCMPSLIV